MTTKIATIKKCVYDKSWTAPNNDVIHYHTLTLDNGDVGNVGVGEKYPKKISEGAIITYEMGERNRIKIHSETQMDQSNTNTASPDRGNNAHSSKVQTKKAGASEFFKGQKQGYAKNPSDFIGQVQSFAKDIVVAKINLYNKTKKVTNKEIISDVRELSRAMYDDVKWMLQHQDFDSLNPHIKLPGEE